jgi:hypothetical protein
MDMEEKEQKTRKIRAAKSDGESVSGPGEGNVWVRYVWRGVQYSVFVVCHVQNLVTLMID